MYNQKHSNSIISSLANKDSWFDEVLKILFYFECFIKAKARKKKLVIHAKAFNIFLPQII